MSIYFLRHADLIKIGYSSGLAKRVQTIISGSPVEVSFLGHMPGDREVEHHLHSVFESERFSGEWFVASERLLTFVGLVSVPTMPADAPTVKLNRAVEEETWREMSARVRKAAAHRWPEMGHKQRRDALAELLGWGTRRVRSLYEAQSGMTLRQSEKDALETLLLGRGEDEPAEGETR